MDRALLVLLLVVMSAGGGSAGTYLYLLSSANDQLVKALDHARVATEQALAAERRLAAARSARQREEAALKESVDASELDRCPVPEPIARMLDASAEATRAD